MIAANLDRHIARAMRLLEGRCGRDCALEHSHSRPLVVDVREHGWFLIETRCLTCGVYETSRITYRHVSLVPGLELILTAHIAAQESPC